MLGSIDSNTGSPDLGWDTDQFPMDVKNATQVMRVIYYTSHFEFAQETFATLNVEDFVPCFGNIERKVLS